MGVFFLKEKYLRPSTSVFLWDGIRQNSYVPNAISRDNNNKTLQLYCNGTCVYIGFLWREGCVYSKVSVVHVGRQKLYISV